jgi:FkbM family methyltransferase
LNKLDNIQIHNYAIYCGEGKLSFYQNTANSGGSKVRPVKDHFWYNYDTPEVVEVDAKVLDDLVNSKGYDYPNIIIMDIEGSEFAALKGACNCLHHAQYLYIEFVPHHLSNVANITVSEFLEAITPHFTAMMIVDDRKGGLPDKYTGDGILQKLTEYYNEGISSDLLFLK